MGGARDKPLLLPFWDAPTLAFRLKRYSTGAATNSSSVRVAGNVLGQECVGSLRYAVGHFPTTLKLVVVLSHAQCGAVTEAVRLYLEPRRYLEIATDYAVRSIEDQIMVAVRVAAMSMEIAIWP